MPVFFKEITKRTGYDFAYNPAVLADQHNMDVEIDGATIEEVLDKCFEGKPIDYIIVDKTISLKRKDDQVIRSVSQADQLVLIGSISDESGKPMPGVTIKIFDSSEKLVLSQASDGFGNFKITFIDATKQYYLQFSFVGFVTKRFALKDLKNPAKIILSEETSSLNQVQITAYGETSRRLNPGNISTITAKDIEHNPVTNVLEAIRGRVPGLFIQQNSGIVGGSFDVNIRNPKNFSSINNDYRANSPAPLIVIDGVSIQSGAIPQLLNGGRAGALAFRGGNSLNYLNPSDIESIEILKDADATAIYGSRGAYGVFLITTKKAKGGQPSVNLNLYSGLSLNGVWPELLNTQQYLEMRHESAKNDNITTPRPIDIDLTVYPKDKYTDFRKALIKNYALNNKADLSYSGGSDLTSYRINTSYQNQQSIVRGKGSVRNGEVGLSLNTRSANNKFKLTLQANYLNSVNDQLAYDISSVALNSPNAPDLFLPDGSINWAWSSNNPASVLNTIYKNNVTNFSASTNLSYQIIKPLTFRISAAYSDQNSSELSASPSTSFPPTPAYAQLTKSVFNHYNTRNISVTPIVEYKTALSKGNLNVKLGGEANDRLTSIDAITGSNYSSDALITNPSAGNNPAETSFDRIPFRTVGVFGIAKYVWDEKYILDFNLRRDGSTRFGSGRRFGTFGSLAAAWIFSQEKWFQKTLPFISFGKLRGSSGVVGGDAVPDYSYLNTYLLQSNAYAGKLGVYSAGLNNPYLEWERTRRSEVGLDLGFFSDRILIAADYYVNKSSNQLLVQPLPIITGFNGYSLNTDAVIKTYGWEATLTSQNIKSSNFTWSTQFNITIPRSKLLALPNFPTGTYSNYKLGQSLNGLLLYNYAGVNPQTGNYSFINASGTKSDWALFGPGSLDESKDKTEFRDLSPKFYGGLGNTITYHQFSFDFFFTFTKRLGRTFLAQQGFYPGSPSNIPVEEYNERWKAPGDIAKVPKLASNIISVISQNSYAQSTGAYEDATYARLQNASLTFSLPQQMASKLGVKRATIFLQGQNLWTISKYGNLDPENLNAGTLPIPKVITAGCNVTF